MVGTKQNLIKTVLEKSESKILWRFGEAWGVIKRFHNGQLRCWWYREQEEDMLWGAKSAGVVDRLGGCYSGMEKLDHQVL